MPELRYLKEEDWVKATHALDENGSDSAYRAAWNEMRNATILDIGPVLSKALKDYERDSGGKFPDDISELGPYLPGKPDPSLLGRYRLENGPKGRRISSVPGIFNTDPPDNYEANVSIDNDGSIRTGFGTPYTGTLPSKPQ